MLQAKWASEQAIEQTNDRNDNRKKNSNNFSKAKNLFTRYDSDMYCVVLLWLAHLSGSPGCDVLSINS